MNAAEDNNTVRSRAEYIDVDTSPERVSRLWTKIADELHPDVSFRPGTAFRTPFWQRPHAYVMASVLAVAVAGAGLWHQATERDTATLAGLQQATLETAGDGMAVDLQDGSHLGISAETRVTVEEQSARELRLRLEHGSIDCDVVPNSARSFLVHAPGVIVRVTGTRFRVEVARDERAQTLTHHVEVRVSRGSVEIHRLDGTTPPRTLTAGEVFSMDITDDVRQAPIDVVHADDLPNLAPRRSAQNSASAGAESDAEVEAATAKALLEKGRVARREGVPAAAAQAYQELITRFPSDPRAGLAAFELGRLRMDRLGDLRGAVEALRQAVRLAPGSGFREDALARLVDAYDRLGQQKSCIAARESYLKSFPNGVHANAARARCR